MISLHRELLNYFELKRVWGEGHIEIKPISCNKKCLFTHLSDINAYFFDGTEVHKRYLGNNIELALDLVKKFKSCIRNDLDWYRENFWRFLW